MILQFSCATYSRRFCPDFIHRDTLPAGNLLSDNRSYTVSRWLERLSLPIGMACAVVIMAPSGKSCRYLYPFFRTNRLSVRIYGYITTGCTRFATQTGFPCRFTGTLPPDVSVFMHRPASRADLRVHFKPSALNVCNFRHR